MNKGRIILYRMEFCKLEQKAEASRRLSEYSSNRECKEKGCDTNCKEGTWDTKPALLLECKRCGAMMCQ